MPARKITSDPDNLAYHIIRSVPHDERSVTGHMLTLRLGEKHMACLCRPGEDVHVVVFREDGTICTFYCNDTDRVAQGWDR